MEAIFKICNRLFDENKKRRYALIIYSIVIIPIIMIIGTYLIAYADSEKYCEFTFLSGAFGTEQDGFIINCTTPEEKTWSNGEEAAYSMGAQYDITLQNNNRYDFRGWAGKICFDSDADFKLSDSWNIEYNLENNILTYRVNGQNMEKIIPDEIQRFGYILDSNELVNPSAIVVTGVFSYKMTDFALFYFALILLVMWFILAISYAALRFWYLNLLEKRIRDMQVLNGLISVYTTVMVVDFKTEEVILYKIAEEYANEALEVKGKLDYHTNIRNFVERIVCESDREQFRGIYEIDELHLLLQKERIHTFQYQAQYNGNTYYYESSFILLEENDRCAIMIRNVDEQEKNKMLYKEGLRVAAITAQKANKSKSDFLSHMAHEIRTPMNGIIGMVNAVAKGELDEKQREYIEVIQRSGKDLLSIVNEILDFSKIEAGKMELVEAVYNPRSLLHDLGLLLETKAREKQLDINIEVDDALPELLFGDELRIRQVIINLTNNAIKYTPEGSVTLRVEIIERKDDEYRIKYSVIDTGTGIKDEDKARLFEAFSQVDLETNRGIEVTGLGLSISKQLVELLGGKIEVDSQYGIGSVFSFGIIQKIPTTECHEEIMETFDATGARILVVDDTQINLLVAETLLDSFGIECDKADSGFKALEMLRSGEHYDMILMDHHMPEMDGVETTEAIKEMGGRIAEIPIVALSADMDFNSFNRFHNAGAVAYLTKPVAVDELQKVLRNYLPEEYVSD